MIPVLACLWLVAVGLAWRDAAHADRCEALADDDAWEQGRRKLRRSSDQ